MQTTAEWRTVGLAAQFLVLMLQGIMGAVGTERTSTFQLELHQVTLNGLTAEGLSPQQQCHHLCPRPHLHSNPRPERLALRQPPSCAPTLLTPPLSGSPRWTSEALQLRQKNAISLPPALLLALLQFPFTSPGGSTSMRITFKSHSRAGSPLLPLQHNHTHTLARPVKIGTRLGRHEGELTHTRTFPLRIPSG